MTSTRPFPLMARTATDPEPDLTSIVVIHRAIVGDLERLAARVSGVDPHRGIPPATSGAVCTYTTALLAALRAHHQGEDEVLWPVISAVAGASADLVPLTDDHVAIAAAAGSACRALPLPGAAPGDFGGLRTCLDALRRMLAEHIADEEAHVLPVMRGYLTAGAYRWCEREIRRKTSLRDRMFIASWLWRYARPDERRRLLAARGCRALMLLAVAWPGYTRLERQAFGRDTRTIPAGDPL